MAKKVFLIGVGYIGGSLLTELQKTGQYDISVLVRKDERAEKLKEFGLTVVKGDLHAHDVIEKAAAESEITFHTATADDLPSVKAVLDGLRQRDKKGLTSIYIHTSGTGVLSDTASNEYKSEKIYRDTDPADIDTLSPLAPHRESDLAILGSIKEFSNARLAIMMPPTIYGIGSGPFNRLSMQVPELMKGSLKRGQAGYTGKGEAVWSNVHIDDLIVGYLIILNNLINAPEANNDNIYWFCEGGHEASWREIGESIGRALFQVGGLKSPEATPIPWEEANLMGYSRIQYDSNGTNSRSRAERLRSLGWSPKGSSIFDVMPAEAKLLLDSQA